MVRRVLTALTLVAAVATAVGLWKYPEWVAIPTARAPLVDLLKDPSSAQFRNERIGKTGALCGEVNAKNSMGGYIGFRKYVSLGPDANYIETDGKLDKFSTQDVIEQLEMKTELLKQYNRWRAEGIDVPKYTEDELDDRVREKTFILKWGEHCENALGNQGGAS
jgi:hypothetical protein